MAILDQGMDAAGEEINSGGKSGAVVAIVWIPGFSS
jgi:hypothetical protein